MREPLEILTAGLVLIAMPQKGRGQEASAPRPGPSPCELLGGANFDNAVPNLAAQRLPVLNALGFGQCRLNLYPDWYVPRKQWDKPDPKAADAFVKMAYEHGVRPMILFEFYYHYKGAMPFGTREQWRGVGRAFAERFRPNGTWARENGITNWGITIYSAWNEPDMSAFLDPQTKKVPDPTPYLEAIRGLAEGVHEVDPSLEVIPGGFCSPNWGDVWTLGGLGPLLAPLWNDGTLAGIDLHTYYDVEWAPMEGNYENSVQSNFDTVKKACGITNDILFYATEFNYKKRKVSEEEAARGLLTGIWDNLGVVGNDGRRPVCRLAFPWNIFHTPGQDPEYGMSESLAPWQPTARGKVLKLVAELTRGMRFVSLDPRKSGVFVLEGGGKKLWVWQNRKAWTDRPGPTFTLTDLPTGARVVEVYGWDGLRTTVPVTDPKACTIENLPGEETYMFLAKP